MNITLIQPYFDSHIVAPPLGLGYLAAALKKAGHSVTIIDCVLKDIAIDALPRVVGGGFPDIIGLSIYSNYYTEARQAINALRSHLDAPIVIGGPHVSALPDFSLTDTGADFAIVGEGEDSFVRLVTMLEAKGSDYGSIPGVYYFDRKNKSVVKNPERRYREDISSLSWPAWDLLRPDRYPPAPHGALYRRFPVAPVITTRGCVYNCLFCGACAIWGKEIRRRNHVEIVDEIEYLTKEFNIREIQFEDDNITFFKEHVYDLCNEIIRRKIDIVWSCPNGVRVDTIDKEMLKVMKASGCYLLSFGIESGSQEILDAMGKRLRLDLVRDVITLVKRSGIETWGFFIIGLPGETRTTARKTIDFARSLPLDRAQFCNFTPLPGTRIFDDWTKGKRLSEIAWSDLNFSNKSLYSTPGLSSDEINALQRQAFRAFYLRPRILLKIVLKIKIGQIKWLIKRILAYSYFKR